MIQIKNKIVHILFSATVLINLLSLSSVSSSSSSTKQKQCDNKSDNKEKDGNNEQCQLYLSKSSIPGAGMGVFTVIDIKEGETIGNPEIIIPIYELEETDDILLNKYSWYGNSLNFLEDEVDGYAPGIFALSNGHQGLWNIMIRAPTILHDTDMVGSYAPYYNLEALATRDIKAGEELFLDYGDHYFQFEDRKEKFKNVMLAKDYDIIDTIIDEFYYDFMKINEKAENMDNYQIFWDFYKGIKLDQLLDEEEDDYDEYYKKIMDSLPDSVFEIPNIVKADGIALYNEEKPSSMANLKENGLCIGNHMHVNASTIPNAGRGAFVNRPISKGDVIISSPMLHECNDEFLYYNISYDDDVKGDKYNNMTRKQLLVNYCYTHDKSTLVLCPYGSFINLFNHKKHTPNVSMRWSTSTTSSKYLNITIDELCNSKESIKLIVDYIALRDIQKSEELFINYGHEWDTAWNQYNSKNNKKAQEEIEQQKSASYYNRYEKIIHTKEQEKEYNKSYPKNIYTRCYFHNYQADDKSIWDLKSLEYKGYNSITEIYDCMIYSRTLKYGLYLYTAGMQLYKGEDINYEYIVYNIPRDAIVFYDELFTNNIHDKYAFRHSIMFPDDIFPTVWKNLD